MAKKENKEGLKEKMKVEGLGISDFISKDVKDYLESKYEGAIFTFLGMFLFKNEEFIFIVHEEFESISDKNIMIYYDKKSTEKDLDKLIKFLKTKRE